MLAQFSECSSSSAQSDRCRAPHLELRKLAIVMVLCLGECRKVFSQYREVFGKNPLGRSSQFRLNCLAEITRCHLGVLLENSLEGREVLKSDSKGDVRERPVFFSYRLNCLFNPDGLDPFFEADAYLVLENYREIFAFPTIFGCGRWPRERCRLFGFNVFS